MNSVFEKTALDYGSEKGFGSERLFIRVMKPRFVVGGHLHQFDVVLFQKPLQLRQAGKSDVSSNQYMGEYGLASDHFPQVAFDKRPAFGGVKMNHPVFDDFKAMPLGVIPARVPLQVYRCTIKTLAGCKMRHGQKQNSPAKGSLSFFGFHIC